MRSHSSLVWLAVLLVPCLFAAAQGDDPPRPALTHLERPEPESGEPVPPATAVEKVREVVWDGFVSVQVNVSPGQMNIVGDAANEPSIAVDPSAPNRMVIGWRQFNSVRSSFRRAGWAFSTDGGRSWTFPGSLEQIFRSDPVLAADAEGRFYYYSLAVDAATNLIVCDLFTSDDGGRTWSGPVPAWGGDKAWAAVDRTGGAGHGNFYASWSPESGCCELRVFTRSTDRGSTFMDPIELDPVPSWGSLDIGLDGEVYVAGNRSLEGDLEDFVVARSDDAQEATSTPTFLSFPVDLGGSQAHFGGPNPEGLIGQVWVAVDPSDGPNRGNLYVVASVDPPGADPCDVHFTRSTDRGETWTAPVAINTDSGRKWQWFATMSVAPNGRIDVVWVSSLASTTPSVGQLVYTSSRDAGATWSDPVGLSPSFNSSVGWPQQNKLGDYYHMVSDRVGADLAYAATFNGEEDVYYLRIGDRDCNRNGFGDADDLASGSSPDCDRNGIPDECELAAGALTDVDQDGEPDECDRWHLPPRRPNGRLGG